MATSTSKPTPEAAPLATPAEIAKTYAEVAQRSSRLITEHINRQLARGIAPPTDELGVAQAFMDMTSKLLANPYVLAQAQMSLVWDYFSLWQNSVQRFMRHELLLRRLRLALGLGAGRRVRNLGILELLQFVVHLASPSIRSADARESP